MNGKSRESRRADLASDTAIVEVKTSLAAARGMRDALASLAMTLAEKESFRGYVLLLDPGLSKQFLEQEVVGFKAALRPGIADRLHVVVARGGKIVEGMSRVRQEDVDLVRRGLTIQEDARTLLVGPRKQDEVFLVMLHQWITGQGPMTSKWLEDTVGCNYRTVAYAIEGLQHSVRRHSDRSVSLRYFPEQDWGRFLAVASKARSTMHFADASDQPRSPESLLRRFQSLGREDVAVGGVLGAKRFFEDLDIVGTPQLDLCVHCPGKRVDIGFVLKLDPALERTRDSHRPARLALHFIRRQVPLFDREEDGSLWADPVECLLELYNARLDQQAREFQDFLAMRGRELSGES